MVVVGDVLVPVAVVGVVVDIVVVGICAGSRSSLIESSTWYEVFCRKFRKAIGFGDVAVMDVNSVGGC